MDKNFRVRFIVGLSMFAIALVALYTFNSIPFKILYILFSVVALAELLSFFKRKSKIANIILVIFEILFLIGGSAFVIYADLSHFWYVILGVCGYDIFAYLFGKLCGGKILKNSRPFPHISKNKTWEGTLFGLATAIILCVIVMSARDSFATDWMYLFCGPLALIGDLYESYLKRKFDVKDSNEIVIKYGIFKKLEFLVGGRVGHGGFLDRIDSSAFATTILLIIILIVSGTNV